MIWLFTGPKLEPASQSASSIQLATD